MADKPLAVLPLRGWLQRKRVALYPEYLVQEGQAPVSVTEAYDAERNVFYDEIESICVYKRRDWGAVIHLLWAFPVVVLAAAAGSAYWLLGLPAIFAYVGARVFVWQSEVARVAVRGWTGIEFRIDRPKYLRNARRFFLTMLALVHRATNTPWAGPGDPPELPPAPASPPA